MNISIFMPTIRNHFHERLYNSISESCSRHSWELVLCGPFHPPQSILNKNNVIFCQDYGHPTRACQIAAINCTGKLIYHTVDDYIFLKDSISNAIDQYNTICKNNDIISMRYTEGENFTGEKLPLEAWTIGNNNEYKSWSKVQHNWIINCHFLINKDAFLKWGGFDCCFEYLNHACHDFQFRLQLYNNKIYHSDEHISTGDWQPDITGDHAPIHFAQLTHDHPLFYHIWHQYPDRKYIDINNWKHYPDVWERRFGKNKPGSYSELYPNIEVKAI